MIFHDKIIHKNKKSELQIVAISNLKRAFVSIGNLCAEDKSEKEINLGVYKKDDMYIAVECINMLINGTFVSLDKAKESAASKPKGFSFGKLIGIVVVVLIVISVFGQCSDDDSDNDPSDKSDNKQAVVEEPDTDFTEEEPIEEEPVNVDYIGITVDELYQELKDNALRAETKYQDAYLELTGNLVSIDSDGKYFSLEEIGAIYGSSVLCDITDNAQKEKIMEHNKGDTITIKCQVTTIGEIMGYSVDVIEVE